MHDALPVDHRLRTGSTVFPKCRTGAQGLRNWSKSYDKKREGLAVIFMSGYTDAAALENAKIGSDAILLNKPFSNELLARRISEGQQNAVDPNGKSLAAGNAG